MHSFFFLEVIKVGSRYGGEHYGFYGSPRFDMISAHVKKKLNPRLVSRKRHNS
jgi:hypothetical protein